jgi:hypothetical protein
MEAGALPHFHLFSSGQMRWMVFKGALRSAVLADLGKSGVARKLTN